MQKISEFSQSQSAAEEDDNEQATQILSLNPCDQTPSQQYSQVPRQWATLSEEQRERLYGWFEVSDKQKTHILLYEDSEICVGRDQHCDYVLQEPYVSKKQFRVYMIGDLVICVDHSANGTMWNNTRFDKGDEIIVRPGDTLSAYNSKVEFKFFVTAVDPTQAVDSSKDYYEKVGYKYRLSSKRLGYGTFASVYLGLCKSTRTRVAMKVCKKNALHNSTRTKHGTNYFEEMKTLRIAKGHPNIVKFYEMAETENCIYIMMQYAAGGDLFEYFSKQSKLPEIKAKYIIFQILHGIKHLHDLNIIHRDLKPENVLLVQEEEYPRVLLSDFGMARFLTQNAIYQKTMCGTQHYLAPDVLLRKSSMKAVYEKLLKINKASAERLLQLNYTEEGYGKEVDMWSIGVILYILLSATVPYCAEKEGPEELLIHILTEDLVFIEEDWIGVSEEAKLFISHLLDLNRKTRYTVHQALDDPWIKCDEYEMRKRFSNELDTQSTPMGDIILTQTQRKQPDTASQAPPQPKRSKHNLASQPVRASTVQCQHSDSHATKTTDPTFKRLNSELMLLQEGDLPPSQEIGQEYTMLAKRHYGGGLPTDAVETTKHSMSHRIHDNHECGSL
ncbi:kinase-like domain-containing protein [Syncephalis plumigaleata]|nr:kinase-like domain-containing protein [Syncephalis plumigaleata]